MITEEPPAPEATPGVRRLILFGAFDRHNFGDLLLAHCSAAAHPGREAVLAGLVRRDLTADGGQRVRALDEVIATHGGEPADFVHVGGEILTTTAWEAAVMLQTPAAAARAIAALDRDAAARERWAAEVLGCARRIPYVVARPVLPAAWRVHFQAVGGTALDTLQDAERDEVLAALAGADSVTVRDARTRAALARIGIAAGLVPDPAAATARLFGAEIHRRALGGEMAALAARMPRGDDGPRWIALQLAAQWGDDASLDRIARLVRPKAERLHAGIALFRAGLAPWHDDLEPLARLAGRLAGLPVAILESPHLLDICALLAHARAYFGTSLHGWIVADSFGVAGRCLVRGAGDKAAAYVDTWKPPGRCWRMLVPPIAPPR